MTPRRRYIIIYAVQLGLAVFVMIALMVAVLGRENAVLLAGISVVVMGLLIGSIIALLVENE